MTAEPNLFSTGKLLDILSLSQNATAIYTGKELLIQTANDVMIGFWGKDRDVIGQPLEQAVPELAGQPFIDLLREVWRTGITYKAKDAPARLLAGGQMQTFYYDFIYEAIKDVHGNIYCVVHTATDVTELNLTREIAARAQEQQQALEREQILNEELATANEELRAINEELHLTRSSLQQLNGELEQRVAERTGALSASEEVLRLAVQAAGMGTYSINTRTFEFYASSRLKELFGFDPQEELPHSAYINQIREDYRLQAQALVDAAMQRGERFELEYPVRGYRDGTERWLRGVGTRTPGSSTGDSFFTGTIIDITEMKQDDQRKSDFIGMVSHELKTPLTTMNGYLQILGAKAKKAGDSSFTMLSDKAALQVAKMTAMINGFLNVSRLDSGKIRLNLQRFDLSDLIGEIGEETQATVSSHHLVFAPIAETLMLADREKIGHVMSNLLSNAVKYSPAGSTIRVDCITEGGMVRVSVQDEGIGIAPADREKLFERYFRTEKASTSAVSGFGIGLYLAAEIVNRHHGRIWVESREGQGSIFYFLLPVAD